MISIIIPVFNEQETLQVLYDRIVSASSAWNDEWELVLVDDGSVDLSFSILEKLHHRDPRVKVVSFSRNFGHQTAVSAGLAYCSGDVAIVMDADLQDPPEQVIHFLQKWREGYQVVYAIRQKRKEKWFKRIAYFCFYRTLAWLSSISIPLDSGDFCVMDRVIVDHLNAMPERNRFVRGLRAWIGYSQIGIPYERSARLAGEVKYTFRKLMRLALDGLINFSYRPLQVVGVFGLVVAGLSFIASILILLARIFNLEFLGYRMGDAPGYASLMLAILFIGGVQLISMGILGEYLGRVFDEVKQRPLYIVAKQLGFASNSPVLPGYTNTRGQSHP